MGRCLIVNVYDYTHNIMCIHSILLSQNLTLTISTERGEHELVLEADPSDISTVNVQSFVEEQVL